MITYLKMASLISDFFSILSCWSPFFQPLKFNQQKFKKVILPLGICDFKSQIKEGNQNINSSKIWVYFIQYDCTDQTDLTNKPQLSKM